jgi:type VI secretion system protein ImpK
MTGGDKDALARAIDPLFQLLLRMERRDGRKDADKLYRLCCTEIESFRSRARSSDLDVSQSDAEDACYALVALLDETAVNHDGPLKEYWQPRLLQVRFFNENVAGEGFFDRLAELRSDAKRVRVLRVYYTCLMLGFRGKHRLRGSELELLEIEEGVRSELQRMRAIPSELSLSPNGRRPYERIADVQRNQLVFSLAAIAAVIAVLLYVGLRLALLRDTELLVEHVTAALGV